MKVIYIIFISLMLTSLAVQGQVQEFKTSFLEKDAENNRLVVLINSGKLTIEGYDGDEVIIRAEGYEPPPDRANGLKPIHAKGRDNSGLGLVVDQHGNTIQITKVNHLEADYFIKIPQTTSVTTTIEPRMDDLLIEKIQGEVEVNAKANDVVLKDISGPVVINNVSGNIDVEFTRVSPDKPSSISVVSGDVDITMPSQSKASFNMCTVSGEIYTDFDIQLNQKSEGSLKSIYRRNPVQCTINNGGSNFLINTVSGNIYLRKK